MIPSHAMPVTIPKEKRIDHAAVSIQDLCLNLQNDAKKVLQVSDGILAQSGDKDAVMAATGENSPFVEAVLAKLREIASL